jgi:hypothetical protein
LAADNTVITQYGPITRKLGDFGNNSWTNPQMSLTGIAAPEGGSLAVSFVVLNKGAWTWDSTAINALELAGSAVLGALAQGGIAAPATTSVAADGATTVVTTAPVSLPEVLAVAAVIIGALEGVNLLMPDCDGVVVPGVLSLGQTELLAYADTGLWNMTFTYPGTDSSDGCGDNSEYAVTYTVANGALGGVKVPNVIGMSQQAATAALHEARLTVDTSSFKAISRAPKPVWSASCRLRVPPCTPHPLCPSRSRFPLQTVQAAGQTNPRVVRKRPSRSVFPHQSRKAARIGSGARGPTNRSSSVTSASVHATTNATISQTNGEHAASQAREIACVYSAVRSASCASAAASRVYVVWSVD